LLPSGSYQRNAEEAQDAHVWSQETAPASAGQTLLLQDRKTVREENIGKFQAADESDLVGAIEASSSKQAVGINDWEST